MPGMLGMLGIGMLLRVGLGKRVNWCVNNAGIWLCWHDRLSAVGCDKNVHAAYLKGFGKSQGCRVHAKYALARTS